MFLSNKPNSRITTATKARLNTHSHKLDETRKRSPEGNPGSPSPSEVIVFNNQNQNHTGSGGRNGQTVRALPEVPQIEEIQRFLKESYERRMHEIKTQNVTVLWIKSDRDEHINKDGSHSQTPNSSQPPTPKQKNSPQHSTNKK